MALGLSSEGQFDSLTDARDRLLKISDRVAVLDPLVLKVRSAIQSEFLRAEVSEAEAEGETTAATKKSNGDDAARHNNTRELLAYIRQNGLGSQILKLTSSLNKTSLDEISRTLLATPGVYEWILLKLLTRDQTDAKDPDGLRLAVLVEVKDHPRERFVRELIGEFGRSTKLRIDDGPRAKMADTILRKGVPLGSGKLVPALRSLFEVVRSEGELREYVDAFVERGEIEESRFTPAVRQSMVAYLEALGLRSLDEQKFKRGGYDEYFAQAYQQSLFRDGSSPGRYPDSPVLAAEEEFRLPIHAELDEQGIVPDSIHAAAVLYQICVVGDQLGMLEMPNALLAHRARGRLDLPSGAASSLLQAYKRFQRSEDVQPEERWLIHKRVFGMGNGKVLDETVVNDEFGSLWDTLMKEIGSYITRDEGNSSDRDERVSRSAIREAIHNLQYNLSFHAADIDEDVRLMMRQYAMAQEILQHRQIAAALGLVRRQTLQAVMEKILAEGNDSMPVVRNMFIKGTTGQQILHLVAKADLSEDEFQNLLRLGEAWIIATGSLPESESPELEDEEDDDFTEEDEEDARDDWE